MQWLIDMAIEAIRNWLAANPNYVWRDDYIAPDFDTVNFTADNTWRELDLSTIVPVGTRGAHIRIIGSHANVNKVVKFRPTTDTHNLHKCEIRTQIANLSINAHFVIGVDSDRKIEYRMDAPNWVSFQLVVRGWWLR